MSRSYKKFPGHCDRCPFMKAKANEKIRHTKNVPNGMAYKKFFESYNIHDYKWVIFGASDLKYTIIDHYEPGWYRKAPQKLPCFEELKKTTEYRRARNK